MKQKMAEVLCVIFTQPKRVTAFHLRPDKISLLGLILMAGLAVRWF